MRMKSQVAGVAGCLVALALSLSFAWAQAQQRTRLFLKDGSYQVVLDYQIVGDVVRYHSAERNGEMEEVPLKLVDLSATEKWTRDHGAGAQAERSVLSPELAKEEAARRARTPEVAPDLLLPDEDSVLALDVFHGTPELVPIPQEGSDLNKETAHAVLKSAINPASIAHQILEIGGAASDVQLHGATPVFYLRTGHDVEEAGGGFVVDTHGAAGRDVPSGGADTSQYVVERLVSRQSSRTVDSFRIQYLGTGREQEGITEMRQVMLPGGFWMKLTPVLPLEPGEYALIEVLNDHEVNLNVWDFGVHAGAKDNVEALRPEPKKPLTLERRKERP